MKKILSSLLISGWLVFSACSSTAPPLPQLGKTPLQDIQVFDNHKNSFSLWQQRGFKNETVIHLDTHLDLNWLSSRDLKMITRENPLVSPDNLVITRDNYLFPAVKAGIINKIYWIVPDNSLPEESTMLAWIKSTFNNHQSHITLEDINSFQRKGKIYEGYLYQTKVIICTLENLPPMKKEVLLDLDLDYLMFNSFYFTQFKLPDGKAFREFLNKITNKNIPVKMVTIAASIGGGYTPIIYRFWSEAITNIWQDPTKSKRQFWQVFKLQNDALNAFNNNDLQHARQLIAAALKIDPDNGDLYYFLSRIEWGLNDRQGWKSAFNLSRRNDPFFQNAYLYEARYALNFNNFTEAKQLYLDHLQIIPDDKVAIVELGDLLLIMGEKEQAFQYALKANDIDANYGNAHMLIGNVLLSTPGSDPLQAFNVFMKAKSLVPEAMNFGDIEGRYYAAQHQHEQAETGFLAAVQKGPHYDDAYVNLGFFYVNGGHADKAQTSFKKALLFNNENAIASFNLGQLFLEAGNTKEGRLWLERTAKLLPNNQMIKKILSELPSSSQ